MLEFLPDAAALMAELGAVYRLEVLLRLLLDQGYRSPFMALFFYLANGRSTPTAHLSL